MNPKTLIIENAVSRLQAHPGFKSMTEQEKQKKFLEYKIDGILDYLELKEKINEI